RVVVESLLVEPLRRVRDESCFAFVGCSEQVRAFEQEIERAFGQSALDRAECGRLPDFLRICCVDFLCMTQRNRSVVHALPLWGIKGVLDLLLWITFN